jgi:hypothetical protein
MMRLASSLFRKSQAFSRLRMARSIRVRVPRSLPTSRPARASSRRRVSLGSPFRLVTLSSFWWSFCQRSSWTVWAAR